MKDYKRITDADVFKVLDSLENQDELAMKEMYNTQMLLLLDIRHFLRKIYRETSKSKLTNIVTDPTKAKENDVVVGKDE